MRHCVIAPRIAILLFLWITICHRAQADVTGSIHGIVRDPTGAVVAGAGVRATHIGTNQTRNARTDETGAYLFLALPVGRYRIEVTQPGFQKFIETEIELTVNEQRSIDVS